MEELVGFKLDGGDAAGVDVEINIRKAEGCVVVILACFAIVPWVQQKEEGNKEEVCPEEDDEGEQH
eukprot:7339273-Ditylum_brightwellii.AAC.1